MKQYFTLATAVLAGCAGIVATRQSFEDTAWQIVSINGRVPPASVGNRGSALTFGSGGVIGGGFGCNHSGGKYRVSGDVMIVTDFFTTLIGCPEPLASFEKTGFAVLHLPMRLNWQSAQRLTLSNSAGKIALQRKQ